LRKEKNPETASIIGGYNSFIYFTDSV